MCILWIGVHLLNLVAAYNEPDTKATGHIYPAMLYSSVVF
jgi:hypothetical protein